MCKLCQILSLCCCLLGWAVSGFTQEKQLLLMEYFGENHGLVNTLIYDIFQDREGFLWIGTSEGLMRFDGHSFRNFRHVEGDSFSITANHVSCITEDAEGNLWVGLLRGGVSYYNRKTGKFRNYPFTEKMKIKTVSVLRIFLDRDGEVWMGVRNNGIVHLNKETGDFKIYDLVTPASAPYLTNEERPTYNISYNFWQDENGLFYCATTDDLYSFDPKTGKATPLHFEGRRPDGELLREAYALHVDGDLIWVGGWASGLRRYNRKTGEWKQYLMDENPATYYAVNGINAIAPKNDNELWITSNDKGFGVFNKTTESFYFYGKDTANYPGLPTNGCGGLIKDNQGNLWLSHNSDLLRIQPKELQFHFTEVLSRIPLTQELSPLAGVFDDREGRFRFHTFFEGDGLQVYDKKSGKTTVPEFKTIPKITENFVVMKILQARDGTIWVLGRHFLYRFNPLTLRLELPAQPPVFSKESRSNLYNMITEDGQGNLWMGTSMFGLFRYNPKTGETTHFMPDEKKPGSVPTNVIGVVQADKTGRLWYASRDKTAYGYYLNEKNRFVYLDVNGKVTNEIATMRINNYLADSKDSMWAFSEQGIFLFNCATEPPQLVKKYTLADGLPSENIMWGTEDKNGNIWVVSGRNLCRLEPNTGKITKFGVQDGYPVSHTNFGSLQDGEIYFAVSRGYVSFHPDSLRPFVPNRPIVLTSFKVNDTEQYNGSNMDISEALIVPEDGRYFTLEFASLDFTHPELLRYEYQLEGLNNEWVKSGSRRLVNYSNIPSGHYTFKVKLEGQPESEALLIPLLVKVAFYKTNWFWMLVAAILVGVVFAYFRNRQLQRQKMSKLLNKAQLLEKEKALVQYESLKQQLNPHFLFNSLTSLGSLISMDPKAAVTFLDSLSKTYRYILKSSERETVPLGEELKFGESFIKLQRTRFGEGLQVNFKVNEEDFHRKIVPVTLQNLLENAIKHNIIDEDEPLVIDVFVEGDYLVVQNNLQRKKFVETSNKRGLTNLQSFYRYLSDKPIVVEEDGAIFRIKIPLI